MTINLRKTFSYSRAGTVKHSYITYNAFFLAVGLGLRTTIHNFNRNDKLKFRLVDKDEHVYPQPNDGRPLHVIQ